MYDRGDCVSAEGKLSCQPHQVRARRHHQLQLQAAAPQFCAWHPEICLAILVTVALAASGNLTGIAAILAAVFFMGGVQLFRVGVLAEYIGRIYEVRRRPFR
jgi:hypothetical protein